VEIKSRFEILQLTRIVYIIVKVKLVALKPSTICFKDNNIGTLV
jgi:hypothetical protein